MEVLILIHINQVLPFVGNYTTSENGDFDLGLLYQGPVDASGTWTSYTYNNQPAYLTHFEGITTDTNGGYNLVADVTNDASIVASFVNVPRTSTNTFGTASWTPYAYPDADLTSANTVYLNYALGIYEITAGGAANGYVVTIPE